MEELLNKGLNNLLKLDYLYDTVDIERKREIIGSIYPEKLTFDGLALRTTKTKEVIQLIYKLDEGYSENKNRTNGGKSDLSCKVGLPGFEPIKFPSFFLRDKCC